MNTKEFKNGVISATLGSLWWGVLGTYFFQFITSGEVLENGTPSKSKEEVKETIVNTEQKIKNHFNTLNIT